MKMKIDNVINEFRKGNHLKGNYLVYALKPYKASDGKLYAMGTYIIKDEEASKRKFAKITNRKNIELVNSIIIR